MDRAESRARRAARRLAGVLVGALLNGGPVLAEDAPPATPEAQAFDIAEFRVRGNHVLPVPDVEAAVLPFLGRARTVADIERARVALEKAYHDRGFLTVYVDVPPQKVIRGIVLVRVTEGSVRRVHVSGSRYHSLERIREGLPSLAKGGVPDFHALERELREVNATRDLRVTPVLKAAPTPGQVDVELQVKDQLPLHGSVEVSNRQSLYTTATRLTAQMRYDNLWQRGHSIGVFYEVAPERHSDADVRSISYAMPLSDGQRLAVYGVRSRSDVAAVGGLNVLGQGSVIGARWSHALDADAMTSRTLTFGADYKDFNRNISFEGFRAAEIPVRYTPLGVEYNETHRRSDGYVSLDGGLSFLMRGLASSPDQFDAARRSADTGFVVLRGGAQRMRTLPGDWSVFARLDGQWASGPLVSNEQLPAGGVATVRGYREFEVIGDRGVRGSLEVRMRTFQSAGRADPDSYVFAFVDGAHLDVIAPLPEQQARIGIAGTGVGLRWRRGGMSIDVDGARALFDASRAPVPGNTSAGDHRIHVRVSYGF